MQNKTALEYVQTYQEFEFTYLLFEFEVKIINKVTK